MADESASRTRIAELKMLKKKNREARLAAKLEAVQGSGPSAVSATPLSRAEMRHRLDALRNQIQGLSRTIGGA